VLYLVQRFLESALDLEDLERGVGQTLRRAARNPGRVARRYVDGERREFVNPLGYFLLTATATFLIFSIFQEAWVQSQAEAYEVTWRSLGINSQEVFRPGSPLRSLGWSSTHDLAAGIFQVLQQVQTYVGLFTCVAAGLFLRWAFPERTVAETLVFELYVTAQATLFLGVLSPLFFWAAPAYIGILPIFLQVGLHTHSAGAFFGTRWRARLLPACAYLASGIVLVAGSGLLIVGTVSYLA
jgi:Protein of unknown function (DUF3667).